MKILFCGTRHYIPSISREIEDVIKTLDSENDTIIHGGCSGVDSITDRLAKKYGFKVIKVDAEWKKYGKSAGPIRNKKMADIGIDKAYAFPFPDLQQSRGTKNMVDILRKRNVDCIVSEK